jgi:hypothetical protein
LDNSTPTSESDSDALCNGEWWAEKNKMANILMVLRKEEENNKEMTAAERSQFGFCGTISVEFSNAARKVCNLAGATRTEMGTVRAVRAVYARAYRTISHVCIRYSNFHGPCHGKSDTVLYEV